MLGVLRKTLPKDMVRWNARAELRGAILRDDDDKKCSTVTRPNGEQTTAVTMDTSPTSSDLGNLRCSRMSALGSEGVWCQRLGWDPKKARSKCPADTKHRSPRKPVTTDMADTCVVSD